jgi:hypothetical protein
LLQKSSKVGDRVTEVDGDDGECSVDAGRVLNDVTEGPQGWTQGYKLVDNAEW